MTEEYVKLIGHWGAPDRVFDRLEGGWILTRSITHQATMHGAARFSRTREDSLSYHERVQVRLSSGNSYEAYRDYVFKRDRCGFIVLFAEADQRLFHQVALTLSDGCLLGVAEHLCSADRYLSTYKFLPDGSYAVEHRVSGPKKAYVSTTVYSTDLSLTFGK